MALEAIETGTEKAEAQSLLLKVLDPNGKMRRDIMQFVCRVYGFYLIMAVALIFMNFFGIGGEGEAARASLDAITSTFMPITSVFGVLASASFGVNASNNWKDTKLREG